jgi:hypothetical protein
LLLLGYARSSEAAIRAGVWELVEAVRAARARPDVRPLAIRTQQQ